MEKYDAAFSATENELIYEARLIPPDMERIEALLRQGADLNKIGAASQQLLALINDLLEISRLEQGNVSMEIKPFDLVQNLETCLSPFQTQAKNQGKTFQLSIDVKNRMIKGDPARLSQVLNNLVSSAEDRFLREFYYVIIDEADMVLMDAATMPLVISGVPRVQSNLYRSPCGRWTRASETTTCSSWRTPAPACRRSFSPSSLIPTSGRSASGPRR